MGRHLVLSAVLNIGWGLAVLVALPPVLSTPLQGAVLVFPDLGYLLLASGAVALGWGVIRTVLALLALRNPPATTGIPITAAAPAEA